MPIVNAGAPQKGLGLYLRRFAWRPIPVALVLAGGLALRRGTEVNFSAASPAAAVAQVLAARGIACDAGDVVWAAGPAGLKGAMLGGGRALVRGSEKGDPHDIYLVEARLSPEGKVLDVGNAWNLTRSNSVDETLPVLHGALAAYTTQTTGAAPRDPSDPNDPKDEKKTTLVTGVHVLDLNGYPADAYDDLKLTKTQRVQLALTNLQQTGQTAGIVHDAFIVDPPAEASRVTVAWEESKLRIEANGAATSFDPRATGDARVTGASLKFEPGSLAPPENLPVWLSHSVERMAGDENMMFVKAIAFALADWANEHFGSAVTDADIDKDFGTVGDPTVRAVPTFTDPESGWPPGPLKPIASPALTGEGEWISVKGDPFVTQTPGAPTAFLTTFIRPNAKRLDLKVFITLWDPRQIELHMEAGTVEPVSSTGERGGGQIPRTPEVMKHVVAAFEGGFQAQHGEFGMQVNHIMYLPPKPYAATVMEMRDGSTAFGSWPNSATVPDEVLSFRQNLTALIEADGTAPKFNPWQRTWWGGTPPGWADTVHTARSAICLTKESFVAYFYSVSISPEDIAAAALATGCIYAIHLDMNPGHAGFEFYNVQPASTWKPLGRPMQKDWEDEGKVPGMADWMFRSRRMIKSMWHMNFPRYIGHEGRDFFYLTTRTVLPGAPLVGPFGVEDASEGTWRVNGLPQHGFPYALATTVVRPDARRAQLKVRVLRVDPRTVRPSGGLGTTQDAPTVLLLQGPAAPAAPAPPVRDTHKPEHRHHPAPAPSASMAAPPPPDRHVAGEWGLWYSNGLFAIGATPPASDATLLTTGLSTSSNPAPLGAVRAAVGIGDEDGMLSWVELPADAPPEALASLDALLEKMGCSTRMFVVGGARALLGGALDIAGNPAPGDAASGVRLVRGNAPGAHLLFEDNTPLPYNVWQPLQSQRVKVAAAAKPSPAPNPK